MLLKPDCSYNTARANGAKYMQNPAVQSYIKEYEEREKDLLSNAPQTPLADVSRLTTEAHEIYEKTLDSEQYTQALAAIDLKAKLNHVYSDKRDDAVTKWQVLINQLIVRDGGVRDGGDSGDIIEIEAQ